MINPTKTADHVIADGLPGERQAFTIKATGKAFRVLIDGLYEKKIAAVVRELVSNGWDAMQAAGTPEIPLQITAPTQMDPTFKVRDTGVSMSHQTVMDVYSAIFHSTKEDTNDQVGMFGLGSKSPFAYTDTFSVSTWLNGEMRVYVAHVSDDDVPQITHVLTEPSDEPTGVEVSIPVKSHDVGEFNNEIARMCMASDVLPTVDGLRAEVPEPVCQGDGWRIYRDTYRLGDVAVRQGCVIYPVHSLFTHNVAGGYTTVVDLPIGSVEVTASRESLSLKPDTEALVKRTVRAADDAIKAYGEGLTFKNRLDAFQMRHSHSFLAFRVGRSHITLTPDKPVSTDKLPGQVLTYVKSARKWGDIISTDNPDRVVLIVEDQPKIIRKQMRIAEFYKRNSFKRICLVQRRDLPRLVRLLDLDKDQVIALSSLLDVPVLRGPSGTSTAGKFAAPKTFPAGSWWVEKTGQKTIDLRVGGMGRYSRSDSASLRRDVESLGIKFDDVVFLTAKQAAERKAPQSQLLTTELIRRAEAIVKADKLQDLKDRERTATWLTRFTENQYDSDGLCGMVRTELGLSTYTQTTLVSMVWQSIAATIKSEFQAVAPVELTLTQQNAAEICNLSGKNLLTESEIHARVRELVKPFAEIFAKGHDPIEYLMKFYINNNKEEADTNP